MVMKFLSGIISLALGFCVIFAASDFNTCMMEQFNPIIDAAMVEVPRLTNYFESFRVETVNEVLRITDFEPKIWRELKFHNYFYKAMQKLRMLISRDDQTNKEWWLDSLLMAKRRAMDPEKGCRNKI